MFYAVLPTSPPSFAVQPDSLQLTDAEVATMLRKLELHFMLTVVLVSWDATGAFKSYGSQISEDLVTGEDLVWRAFELPPDPEVPF